LTTEISKIKAKINDELSTKINSQTYHNNFNQIVNEFEIVRRTISSYQNKINQQYSLIQSMSKRGSDQQNIFPEKDDEILHIRDLQNAGTISVEGYSAKYLSSDLGTIELEIPIASGVIDIMGSEDIFTKLLTLKTKQILSKHLLCNNEFPNQIGAMLNEFILLKLDIKANELVLVEISYLFSEQDKENSSSKARLIQCELGKIPVLGIQVIGEHIIISMLDLFKGVFYQVYQTCKITIPLQISMHQVVEKFLRGSLKLRAIVKEIVRMSVYKR
ncbi:17151_t:CDS:2, partial [Gigaspora margarita]